MAALTAVGQGSAAKRTERVRTRCPVPYARAWEIPPVEVVRIRLNVRGLGPPNNLFVEVHVPVDRTHAPATRSTALRAHGKRLRAARCGTSWTMAEKHLFSSCENGFPDSRSQTINTWGLQLPVPPWASPVATSCRKGRMTRGTGTVHMYERVAGSRDEKDFWVFPDSRSPQQSQRGNIYFTGPLHKILICKHKNTCDL